MIFGIVVGSLVVAGIVWYFWKRHPIHLSFLGILEETAALLKLQEVKVQKYPVPTLVGMFYGFRIALEGGSKRYLATVTLHQPLGFRLFLQNEKQKTKFKPIADLKLVTTGHLPFDQQFLLLSDDEKKAKTVFGPYLCGKIMSASETDWKMDVEKKEAHLEIWASSSLSATRLSEWLQLSFETLNDLVLSESGAGSPPTPSR